MSNLKDKVIEAGIVGSGGAGFPTHVKMNGDIDTIVINAAECEPLIQVDKGLINLYSKELVEGLKYTMNALGIEKSFIGIKEKYQNIIQKMEESIKDDSIKISPLPNIYPVGDEVVLIKEVTGKVVKKGGLPLDHKIMVMNVETLLNIYNKIFKDNNVVNSYVTVIGEVHNEGTYNIPIGMPVSEILTTLTPVKIEDYEIIVGGPMTGTLAKKDEVITKTTKAIIVLRKDHPLIRNKENVNINHLTRIMAACSQCRACTDMCPRNLLGHKVEPHKLMNAMANGLTENVSVLRTALGCVNCGVCETYACHHDLAPRKMMVKVKEEFAKNGVRPSAEDCVDVHTDRDYRKVPSNRLIMRLNLSKYNRPVPFNEKLIEANVVKIPLSQHIGAPAEPCVSIGQKVEKGQVIAKAQPNKLSTNIHGSIEGTIKEITKKYIMIERT